MQTNFYFCEICSWPNCLSIQYSGWARMTIAKACECGAQVETEVNERTLSFSTKTSSLSRLPWAFQVGCPPLQYKGTGSVLILLLHLSALSFLLAPMFTYFQVHGRFLRMEALEGVSNTEEMTGRDEAG